MKQPIDLTSPEITGLWKNYLQSIAVLYFMNHSVQYLKDEEITALVKDHIQPLPAISPRPPGPDIRRGESSRPQRVFDSGKGLNIMSTGLDGTAAPGRGPKSAMPGLTPAPPGLTRRLRGAGRLDQQSPNGQKPQTLITQGPGLFYFRPIYSASLTITFLPRFLSSTGTTIQSSAVASRKADMGCERNMM